MTLELTAQQHLSLFTFTTSVQFPLLAEVTETQPGKKALAELTGGE